MACENKTIDSNTTGVRIAEEACPGILPDGSVDFPGTPIWNPAEPNSYDDFGGQITTKPRTPINRTRQRKKGSPVDLEASGGYTQDFTETGFLKLLQGFLFADAHIPGDTKPVNGNGTTDVTITSLAAADSSFNAAAGLDIFATDDIILVSGCAIASNNGIKTVASAIAGKLTTDQPLVDEVAPPASVRIQKVGKQTTDLSVVVTGTQVSLVSAAAEDFTTWPIFPGSWIFIGSDTAAFSGATNKCFARVDAITPTSLTLGKTTKLMVAEAGPVSVDIMLPIGIRNEPNPDNIKLRTYQIERTVGRDANGVMSEYLTNSTANEFTLNIPTGDYLTADVAFISGDNEQRTGLEGVKAGDRPSLISEDAYNTSSDMQRFRLATVVSGDPFPTALFGYATEGTITINNNVTTNKAIGVLGGFSTTVGSFDVGGSLTAYFATMDAVKAVRQSLDVTLDLILTKNNAGWIVDMPLIGLGDGRLNVEANTPITLPLELSAAESDLGHTLYMARFQYLPDIAM